MDPKKTQSEEENEDIDSDVFESLSSESIEVLDEETGSPIAQAVEMTSTVNVKERADYIEKQLARPSMITSSDGSAKKNEESSSLEKQKKLWDHPSRIAGPSRISPRKSPSTETREVTSGSVKNLVDQLNHLCCVRCGQKIEQSSFDAKDTKKEKTSKASLSCGSSESFSQNASAVEKDEEQRTRLKNPLLCRRCQKKHERRGLDIKDDVVVKENKEDEEIDDNIEILLERFPAITMADPETGVAESVNAEPSRGRPVELRSTALGAVPRFSRSPGAELTRHVDTQSREQRRDADRWKTSSNIWKKIASSSENFASKSVPSTSRKSTDRRVVGFTIPTTDPLGAVVDSSRSSDVGPSGGSVAGPSENLVAISSGSSVAGPSRTLGAGSSNSSIAEALRSLAGFGIRSDVGPSRGSAAGPLENLVARSSGSSVAGPSRILGAGFSNSSIAGALRSLAGFGIRSDVGPSGGSAAGPSENLVAKSSGSSVAGPSRILDAGSSNSLIAGALRSLAGFGQRSVAGTSGFSGSSVVRPSGSSAAEASRRPTQETLDRLTARPLRYHVDRSRNRLGVVYAAPQPVRPNDSESSLEHRMSHLQNHILSLNRQPQGQLRSRGTGPSAGRYTNFILLNTGQVPLRRYLANHVVVQFFPVSAHINIFDTGLIEEDYFGIDPLAEDE